MSATLMPHESPVRKYPLSQLVAGDLLEILKPGNKCWKIGELVQMVELVGYGVRVLGLGESKVYDLESLQGVTYRVLFKNESVKLTQER